MEFQRHLGGHREFWIGVIQAHHRDVHDEDQGAETVDQDPLFVCHLPAKHVHSFYTSH